MITTLTKLSAIKRNPNNPRILKDDKFAKLTQSIKDFPQMLEIRPIVVNDDMIVLGGNMRLKACKEAGLKEVPVIKVSDLTEEQQREFIIKDNVGFGEWDWDLLANEWDTDLLEDWGLDLDFDPVDDDNAGLTDEDDTPEVTEVPVSKVGDIWLLGEHRVMCGDSTNGGDVALLMNGEKADMVFTDPPYGMNLDTDYSKLKGTEKSPNAKGYKWDKVIGDDADFEFPTFYKHFESVKEQFWWGADYYFNKLPTGGGLMVWQKRDKADAEMIGNDFELCWSKQRHKKATFWKRWVGFDSIERGEKRVHPTQKPIDLAVWFYEKWGGKGDLIVDLFLGSGTALIAAENKNRKCYGMELDPKYVDVIIKRWQDYTGKIATHAETGDEFVEVDNGKI